jgi:hypothetical protein
MIKAQEDGITASDGVVSTGISGALQMTVLVLILVYEGLQWKNV